MFLTFTDSVLCHLHSTIEPIHWVFLSFCYYIFQFCKFHLVLFITFFPWDFLFFHLFQEDSYLIAEAFSQWFVSAQATVTEFCSLSGLNKTYFSQFWSLESPRSRCWINVVLVRTIFLAHSWLPPCCLVSLFIRSLIPSWGSAFLTSSQPKYLPQAPPPHTIPLEVRTYRYEFGGDTSLLSIQGCFKILGWFQHLTYLSAFVCWLYLLKSGWDFPGSWHEDSDFWLKHGCVGYYVMTLWILSKCYVLAVCEGEGWSVPAGWGGSPGSPRGFHCHLRWGS